uniref:Uncharacterized protein n=1 Tax=Zea mays TaxID=4577 RepID=B6TSA3_MAIZE|nr:hypothetical protein [Zea mays]
MAAGDGSGWLEMALGVDASTVLVVGRFWQTSCRAWTSTLGEGRGRRGRVQWSGGVCRQGCATGQNGGDRSSRLVAYDSAGVALAGSGRAWRRVVVLVGFGGRQSASALARARQCGARGQVLPGSVCPICVPSQRGW